MAARKKDGGDVGEGLKKLWRTVNPSTWAQLLREAAPQNNWQLSGTTIKGRCPYHPDNDPSFVLDFAKGFGRCYGAGCNKYVDNIVLLFSKLLNVSDSEASLWLNERIDLSSALGSSVADRIGEYSMLQDMKKHAAMAFSQVLQEYIREKPERLSYLEPGFLYLTKGRNIPVNVIGSLPVAVFPKPEHAKKYMPEGMHQLYDSYFQKLAMYNNYWGSIIFHYNDSPGSISKFKVRLLDKNVHKILASIKEKENPSADLYKMLVQHDFRFIDDPFVKKGTGLFGLHYYARSIGSTDSCVYVTEGEFDALSVMAGQIETEKHDLVMLASGGKGNTALGFLRDFGLRVVYLVQDSPAKKGDELAQEYLSDRENFTRNSSNIRLQFKIFSWPVGLPGSDLDEAVQISGYDVVSGYLEQGDNFINALPWVEQKCFEAIDLVRNTYDNKLVREEKEAEEKIQKLEASGSEDAASKTDAIKAQLENARANNADEFIHEATSIVRSWGKCLSDPSDLKVFLQLCSQNLGRDVTELEPDGSGVYSPETMDGAVEIIKRVLPNYLTMTYYEKSNGRTDYHMWSKTKYEDVVVPSNDARFSILMAQSIGMTLTDWLRTHLGRSSVIEPKSEKCEPSSLEAAKKRSENAKFLMNQVLEAICSQSQSLDDLMLIGQGIHYVTLSEEAKHKNNIYVVNGAKLFKGTYGRGAGQPVEWEMLNSNVDCGMLFQLDKSAKWSFISDVDHLYAATKIDVHALYENVKKVVGCWKFKHNDIMQRYIPAYIMAIPFMMAMNYVTLVFLQGPTTSGKTAFVQGLLGGTKEHHRVKPLIESSVYTTNASLPWLQRKFNGSSLMLCMDESENQKNTNHGNNVREIQEALYGVSTGGGSINRAAADGSAKTVDYRLTMPVIMCGINMYSDDVFLSRMLVIMTSKDTRMLACENAIDLLFTPEEYANLRQQVTLSMLPYMPQLVAKANELKKRLDAEVKSVGGNTRFVNTLLPGLAVYALVNPDEDVLGLFRDIVEINRDRLDAINNTDEQNDVLNAALNLPGVKAPNAEGIIDYQPARTLIQNGEITLLNGADCGVYCIPEKRWIVLVWKYIKYNVFKQQSDYSRMRENAMREAVLQSKYTVTDILDSDHKYIVNYLNQASSIHSKTEYSVVRLDCILSEEEQEALAKSYKGKFAGAKPSNETSWDGKGNEPPIEVYDSDIEALPYSF